MRGGGGGGSDLVSLVQDSAKEKGEGENDH